MQALLQSGALVLSVSRAATSELQSEDRQQLSKLLSVCLPGCGASCAEVTDVLAEVGKTLQSASPNTKVRLACRFCISVFKGHAGGVRMCCCAWQQMHGHCIVRSVE